MYPAPLTSTVVVRLCFLLLIVQLFMSLLLVSSVAVANARELGCLPSYTVVVPEDLRHRT